MDKSYRPMPRTVQEVDEQPDCLSIDRCLICGWQRLHVVGATIYFTSKGHWSPRSSPCILVPNKTSRTHSYQTQRNVSRKELERTFRSLIEGSI